MTKQLIAWIFACLSGLASAQEIASVNIGYAERDGPQGTYLLVGDKEGQFSLKSIAQDRNLPEVKIEGIIPVLEKEYPFLAGKITVSPLDIKTVNLIKTGEVYVFGHIKKPGKYSADTLGACMTKAEPTEFGSIKRIQVINGGKSSVYDMTQKTYSEMKLQPGAIILVPMKRVIGL